RSFIKVLTVAFYVRDPKPSNPFADTGEDDAGPQGYIHIRIQQRNGRKTLTTVQGLPVEYDQKKLLKAFKKEFACNGTLVQDEELGQVIQLQGDQRIKKAFYCSGIIAMIAMISYIKTDNLNGNRKNDYSFRRMFTAESLGYSRIITKLN
ncbi:2313_t:CDS:2, partial [Dentiscutata heterogama]